MYTGEATWDEALLLFLERSGYSEETYHTFSYSPLADDNGTICGMLCVVTEETERVIGERRMALLREIASALAAVQTIEDVFNSLVQCLTVRPHDLPFTLTYLLEPEESTARLVCSTGIPARHPVAAPLLPAKTPDIPWSRPPFLAEPVAMHLDDLASLFTDLPAGPWEKSPQQALLVPIIAPGQERPVGFLVAAINPYRQMDDAYRGFVHLLAGQIAASLASARAYEAEKRRAEALAELDRAKTTFFSNVSHEFRTPLTLMLGPVEDILAAPEEDLLPEYRANLTVVHRNGERLLKLVNTLLDFTRIEAGRVQVRYEPTDLAAYTEELASVFRSAIEKAGLRLILHCDPLSEPVFVDRDMWEKIVLNLLSNAFKFTLEGEIEVALHNADDQAVLTVRDTGTGITEEQMPHVFERFHRVEGTRARTHEGTGIGLALVQELVRIHGGIVRVDSTYGVGTTFTVSLPLGKAHLPAERISAPTTLASTALRAESFVEEALRWLPEETLEEGSSEADSSYRGVVPFSKKNLAEGAEPARLLLADDNTDMREYVRRLLQPYYEVIAVSDGAAALAAARKTKFDLVLSDVMMPVLDGFGLLQALRNDPGTASVPVILLSARAGEEARIEGLSAGADDYLIKPFSARELLARVAAHLNLSRVRREAEQVIRENEERFRVALSNVPLTVFTCDRELRYTWIANPPYGLTADHFLGKRDGEISSMEEAREFLAYKAQVLDSEQGARQEIAHLLSTTTRYYDITAEPLRDREGNVIGLTVAAFDITDLKQMELNLAAMNARLQRAMTETHYRVKNNLQLMSALIDMQRASGEEMVPMSELTRLGANVRALGVIHDLLTQEAKEGSDQETLSIKAVLERLMHMLEQTIGDAALVYSFEEARFSGRQTTAIALVANELISNALKHGRGRIEIYLRINGDTATLEVCDDGPGFPAGFDAAAAANTGLELVESVAEWDLRGTLNYANRREGGAQVVVTFPLHAR